MKKRKTAIIFKNKIFESRKFLSRILICAQNITKKMRESKNNLIFLTHVTCACKVVVKDYTKSAKFYRLIDL